MPILSRPDLCIESTFGTWVADVVTRHIGPAPCPACTDCDGNLCEACERRWQEMVTDHGGEA